MPNLLPKSRIIRVEFEVALPISATREQIEEWIDHECCHSGGMALDNPLLKEGEPEAISSPVLTDTRRHLHSEAIDNQDGTHTIRRWTEDRPAWGPSAIDVILAEPNRRTQHSSSK